MPDEFDPANGALFYYNLWQRAEATVKRQERIITILVDGVMELGGQSYYYEGEWPDDDYITREMLVADLESRA